MKDLLGSGEGPGAREVPARCEDFAETLQDTQNMLALCEQSWMDKLTNTRRLEEERQEIMGKMGISIESSGIQVKSG